MTELSLYQQVLHRSRYARWIENDNRRENLPETVERYVSYFCDRLLKRQNYVVDPVLRARVTTALTNLEIMPSMRAFMTAGVALDSAPVAAYNCAYLPFDHPQAFSEHMYVLMCGAGSGFSVEYANVSKLPSIPAMLKPTSDTIHVKDSREGWCEAVQSLIDALYSGMIPGRDTSKVRPEGARLNTFGGFASGPGPLNDLMEHIVKTFKGAQGRQLTPYEVFGIACMIAQIVVVGGVRRSATICLFDASNVEMRRAKSGQWWLANPHFAMANISCVYETKPTPAEFEDIWGDLVASGSGEAGIMNREALWAHCESNGRSNFDASGLKIAWGVNPCGEIILQPYSFCNLTGNAIRPDDTLEMLLDKQELATIMGTWQATVSEFEYLRPMWRENTERERLLGVCLAGIMDHPVLNNVSDEAAAWLRTLRECALEINQDHAAQIGIGKSHSVTSIKPAGNSGELYNVASGIHPRYAPYYIRTIRQSAGDPMTQFLKDNGIPWEVSAQNPRDVVFAFPIASPNTAKCAADLTAIEQLEHWRMVKSNYTTHIVSCTVYVRTDEWDAVGEWVFDHFDDITGLSFLPFDDHTYAQAPYQPISREAYERLQALMPKEIDWTLMKHYEKTDMTTVSQELACTGGQCTI